MPEFLHGFLLGFDVGDFLLGVAITILSDLVKPYVRKALKRACLAVRGGLRAAGGWCHRAGAKVAEAFRTISLLAEMKRLAARFAEGVVRLVFGLAYVCIWGFLIVNGINRITSIGGKAKAAPPRAFVTSRLDDCNCTAPSYGYAEPTIQPAWGGGVSPRDCDQGYAARPRYPVGSLPVTAEGLLASDCAPARKGRKGKRAARRPCAVASPPSVIDIGGPPVIDGGGYGTADAIR